LHKITIPNNMRKEEKRTSLSLKSRFKSFTFAARGIVYAIKSQPNLWLHLLAAIAVIALGIYYNISTAEWFFIIFAIGIVLSAELFNSSIEKIVDLIQPEKHKFAGQAKDMAAGAVLITAFAAATVGFLIFLPKIIN
jgi:diacylglycerol kinase (ATP)